MIGDANDIVNRVRRLIPNRWFQWAAPNRDALLGGIADGATWCYSWIGYARLQTRLATATGLWLDIYGYDFLRRYLLRQGMSDSVFRAIIKATILQERVTRAGMVNALLTILGVAPQVIEPWNTGDCGGYGCWNLAYNKAGAWGSIKLPGQVFLKISTAGLGPVGVPGVTGYGGWAGGYYSTGGPTYGSAAPSAGSTEYVGSAVAEIGVTNRIIYQIIKYTRPTGVICWTRIHS